MPDSPTPASPWMAGANSGPTVPGQDVTDPDAPDIGQSDVPANAPMPATQGTSGAPAKPGSLFRTLISSLGLALTRGAQAGLTAPRNAQGPAVAAETAQQAPQKDFEQRMANQKALTTADMDKMNIAVTQLKLHQMQMITHRMDEDQQNAVYNKGRDTLEELSKSGKVDILATGDIGAVQAEFNRRQADASKQGQGLLPLQILPSLGSDAKKPQFSLVMVGKEKITDNWDETWGAKDLGYNDEDFKAAGLSTFKFHAAAGMDQQKALQLRATQYLNWASKTEAGMQKWKQGQATIQSREKEGQKNRDMRMALGELQASTRRAVAGMKGLSDQTDKEIISAGKTLIAANKALGDAQGKIGNKAWDVLGGGETREIATKRRARDEAEKNYNALLAKKETGAAVSDVINPKPAAVPKGTPITRDIANSYKQKFGGDIKKAQDAATKDGYVWPTPK
jgi:hypothetical protein